MASNDHVNLPEEVECLGVVSLPQTAEGDRVSGNANGRKYLGH